MTLVGQLPYPGQRITDIWGFVDSAGNEYALVGDEDALSIVDISTPSNPVELYSIDGPSSGWRDMKFWGAYAYCTNESDSGLLIVDLTHIQDSIDYYYFTAGNLNLQTAHNIFIDEKGYAYVVGANVGVGGALFFDLNPDPYNPQFVGQYTLRYIHDLYVRGDTMWSAEVNDGIFSVVDVSNKAAPVVLGTAATSFNFTHNTWLNDAGDVLFTTDEVSGAFVGAYDVSDLGNITELDLWQSPHSSNVIPHNTFWLDDFLITSYYRDGVTITDATHPDNLIETGWYDTSPLSGNGFNGCWGVYPYLPSGLIIATDMEEGLFILQPTYQQASYLEGTVTDSVTGNPINDATISILATQVQESSNLLGEYKTGTVNSGSFSIKVTKPGYFDKIISGVNLSNGVVTMLDVELSPKPAFPMTITVIDKLTQQVIEDAVVQVASTEIVHDLMTDSLGEATVSNFFEDVYEIYVGKWGYRTVGYTNWLITQTANTITVELKEGYYDDFALDLGWTTSGSTILGTEWELGAPLGTTFFDSSSFIHPNEDIQTDLSDLCYSTGNSGDVFDVASVGQIRVESPNFDLTNYTDPHINFYYWLVSIDSAGTGDDSLVVWLDNGTTSKRAVVFALDTFDWDWEFYSFKVSDILPVSANMQVRFETRSQFPFDALLEAAVDVFQVVDSANIQVGNPVIPSAKFSVTASPNPASNRFDLVIQSDERTSVEIEIYDVIGNVYHRQQSLVNGPLERVSIETSNWASGIYFARISQGGNISTERIVIEQ